MEVLQDSSSNAERNDDSLAVFQQIFHSAGEARARKLAARVAPHLPSGGRVLDLGSGVGHNAAALTEVKAARLVEADVTDMHAVGGGPTLFDGRRLPFVDGAFDATVALFVFQYVSDPRSLLRELARVTKGPTVVLQSTYRGDWALRRLRVREVLLGRMACAAARSAGFVAADGASLEPRQFWTRERFESAATAGGLRVLRHEPDVSGALSRDLYVLAT